MPCTKGGYDACTAEKVENRCPTGHLAEENSIEEIVQDPRLGTHIPDRGRQTRGQVRLVDAAKLDGTHHLFTLSSQAIRRGGMIRFLQDPRPKMDPPGKLWYFPRSELFRQGRSPQKL